MSARHRASNQPRKKVLRRSRKEPLKKAIKTDWQFTSDEAAAAKLKVLLAEMCEPSLAELIANHEVVLNAIAEEALVTSKPRGPRPGVAHLMTGDFINNVFRLRWAIRDEDLKLWESLLAGVFSSSGTVALTFVTGGAVMPLATVATIFANLFVFFKRVRKKGVRLSLIEFRVLQALRASEDGLTVDDIEGRFMLHKFGHRRDEIEETLRGLTQRRLRGGAVATLVQQAGDGRWSAAEV